MPDLTDSQLQVVRFIRDYHKKNGYYATVRDVQERFKWRSPSSAHACMTALVRKGFLERVQVTERTFVFRPTDLW